MLLTKPVNIVALTDEMRAGGVSIPIGLITLDRPPNENLLSLNSDGTGSEPPPEAVPIVAAHIALRDKTDEEYSAEFQNPATTAARRQEIRDITGGLLPREQVRVDNGLPLEDPLPPADPLVAVKSASGVETLRDTLVAYLESR